MLVVILEACLSVAFNFFTQARGPEIDIDLFPRARQMGAQTGNAIKTPLEAGIEGAIEGISAGFDLVGKYQQTQIRQNQIEQLPVENRRQEAITRQEELKGQIADIQSQVISSNETLVLEAEKNKLELAKKESDQKLKDINIGNQIASDLSDPFKATQIMKNPEYSQYLMKRPQEGKYVIGQLYSQGILDDEGARRALGTIDLNEALKLKEREKEREFSQLGEYLKEMQTNSSKIRNDGVLGAALPGFSDADADKVFVVPKGTIEIDPSTKKAIIDPKTGKYKTKPFVNQGTGTQYDLLIDGQLSEFSPEIDDTRARAINAWKDSVSRYNRVTAESRGIRYPTEGRTSTPPAEEVSTGSVDPKVLEREKTFTQPYNPVTAQQKLSGPYSSAPVVGEALLEARQLGREANMAQRAFNAITGAAPVGISRDFTVAENLMGESGGTAAQVNTLIKASSATAAAETLQKFKDGDQEVKDSIREWARQNGVQLKYQDLKSFYEDKGRAEISGAYEEAYQAGIQSRGQDIVDQAAQERVSSSLEGLSVDEAVKVRSRVRKKAEENNIPKAEAAGLEKKAVSVQENPYLSNQPYYVKALAMHESGGVTDAKSYTEAYGLMQLTKGTARGLGVDRNIPEENAEGGRRYIENLFQQFNGSRALAYAAYNAGPAVVAYAQKLAGGSDDWSKVRPFMKEALQVYYRNNKKVTPETKYLEVYNFPDKVLRNEQFFLDV